MKKKNLSNLLLNKRVISKFNKSKMQGGKPPATDFILCMPETATCETEAPLNTCYFSCAGNNTPSCIYTECNQGN